MIRFRLFGIPVEIQPFFWLTAALLGGALGASSRDSVIQVGLFMLAAFVSILVHELGHALTGRKLGGGRPDILLWAMGGLARFNGSRLTRSGNLWTTLAGPGAGFAFGAVIAGALFAFLPAHHAELLLRFSLFNDPALLRVPELREALVARWEQAMLLRHFLWINFWWGILNLLPVWPLDGGQALGVFTKRRTTLQVGIAVGAAVAFYGFANDRFYMGFLFAYLAWQNWNARKQEW
jgi:stage IV sporulation protein FB